MNKLKALSNRAAASLCAALLTLVIFAGALPNGLGVAHAGTLGTRSLAITSSAPGGVSTDINGNAVAPGSGGNGAKTFETFQFNAGTTGNIGSMDFLYCTTPLTGTTCTAPTGFTAANVAGVAAQTGATGFTLGSASANEIKVTRTPGSVSAGATLSMTFGSSSSDYITNPTSPNTTWFVRVTTYSDNAYTTAVDNGTVAGSTTQQIAITAKVQESLNFSAGTTVTAPTAACTPFSDAGTLNLGGTVGSVPGILSATTAYTAHSYFRLSTNSSHGVVVDYSGATLTSSAGNTISAIGTSATSSAPGTQQFGLGIDSTDTQSGSGYSFTNLAALSPYNNINTALGVPTNAANQWAFTAASVTSPAPIASSAGIVVCDTGSVSYLGNISYSTSAGIYGTTITYIATPAF